MSKNKSEGNIQTFLRIKPSKNPSGFFSQDELENNTMLVTLPENFRSSDYINNTKNKYSFTFNGIIPMDADQEIVFKKVGVAAVNNALEGFNSTIFAYGQTGSGKTFTLTGGPEKYSDRGIIPRSISMIFSEFRSRTDAQYKAYISYLEIYNEQGYDLLDSSQESKNLEDLPKVSMLEDEHGNLHLKNLSMHLAESEEDALNLLFLGDTNRAIAETPMNMASSRSHCIFSISLEARIGGTDRIRRSKLHLVDLAGSERVAKTNSSGSVLTEAKYINSSLFFLEMVIVALYEKATKGRTHVPYRNSMMTSVLRDSLGGNCKTIMIATINPESFHTEESLSTCRFAQRVSLIKNKVSINEEVDPSLIIRRLKNEVLALREEISFLKNESGEGDNLTPQEIEELKMKVKEYLSDGNPQSILNIGTLTLNKIKQVFILMKLFFSEISKNSGSKLLYDGETNISPESLNEQTEKLIIQNKNLKSLLLERDSEINILVNMVKKGKTADDVQVAKKLVYNDNKLQNNLSSTINNKQHELIKKEQKEEKIVKRHLFGVPPPNDPNIFEDSALSFEWFRSRCTLNQAMNENKDLLKEKIAEAKAMGERATQSKNTISYLKNSIESIRKEKALYKHNNDDIVESNETPEEVKYRKAIDQEKNVYKESFEKLKVLKPEIEHIRKLIEKGRMQMQTQFEQWYSSLHTKSGRELMVNFKESENEKLIEDSKTNYHSESKIEDNLNEDLQAFFQAKEEMLRRRKN